MDDSTADKERVYTPYPYPPVWADRWAKSVEGLPNGTRIDMLVQEFRNSGWSAVRLVDWTFEWERMLEDVKLSLSWNLASMSAQNLSHDEELWAALIPRFSEPLFEEVRDDLCQLAHDLGVKIEGKSYIDRWSTIGDCLLELKRLDRVFNLPDGHQPFCSPTVAWWLKMRRRQHREPWTEKAEAAAAAPADI